jgi:hypothetical protein
MINIDGSLRIVSLSLSNGFSSTVRALALISESTAQEPAVRD